MKRDDLKGIAARKCPDACTADHCVISTVNICKHPFLTGDAGCGPITMANRELAAKVIKINQIEGGESPAPTTAAPGKQPQRRKKARKPRAAKPKKEPPAPDSDTAA